MRFPRLLITRQNFPDRSIPDVPAEVAKQLAASGFADRVKPGARIAIGAGSRGIHNIATIAAGARCDSGSTGACTPFIFPAMGSHGAATAEGQASVLAHYGITEALMGCPVVSQLEVVSMGKTADGDRGLHGQGGLRGRRDHAGGAHQMAHTDFPGKIESGLFKMTAIGLGKFCRGAAVPQLRLQPGPGTCGRHGGAAAAEVRQDSGRAGDSGRRQPQYCQSLTRSRWLRCRRAKRPIWRR